MKAHPDRETSPLIELPGTLIEHYEAQESPTPHNSPGEKLSHHPEIRGLTRAELARVTGNSPSAITNVLTGRREISKATATRLAEFFRVVRHFI